MNQKKVVVIPARLASQRLPNKVLLDLAGKPVIRRVYEQAMQASGIDAVYIATDSPEVQEVCREFTDHVLMTRADHTCGTDRIAEAVGSLEVQAVINVQGDEPFIDPEVIAQLADQLSDPKILMNTVACPVTNMHDFQNPNVVKVVMDEQARALYFSRSPIPFPRDMPLSAQASLPDGIAYHHLGIYGYQKAFLLQYASLPPTYLERIEKLEQLRALENGYPIHIIKASRPSLSIDSPEDLEKARQQFINNK